MDRFGIASDGFVRHENGRKFSSPGNNKVKIEGWSAVQGEGAIGPL
jgi:hypothetical protein